MRTRRAIGAGQLLLGAATALLPARTAAVASRGADLPPLPVVRILGARQIVQGAVTLARPTSDTMIVAAVVDGLHAASLVPIVVGSRRHRAVAFVSAAMATVAAVLEVRASRED